MRPGRSVAMAAIAALLAACSGEAPLALPSPSPRSTPLGSPSPTPSGVVRVAYPEHPSTWFDEHGDDVGATDLAALWGLPLFEIDAEGQLRSGLVADSTPGVSVQGGWGVDLELKPGEWSDGSPVTSHDVARTLQELAAGPRSGEFATLRAAETRNDRVVRLVFDRPTARWPYLLAGAPGVLPASVLDEGGLDAFRDAIPVSGGRFRLDTFEPGLRAVFVAHADSPLGPPGVERLEVLFTPRLETAEGLLRQGRVEMLAGYLTGSEAGAGGQEGIQRAAPTGGTWVALHWSSDGALGGDALARRTIAGAVRSDRLAEGLLGTDELVARSPWPEAEGPWPAEPTAVDDLAVTAILAIPRWSRAIGYAGRAVQRDASTAGATLDLISEEAPDFLDLAVPAADGALVVRRDPPRPSLTAMVPDDAALVGELAAADALGDPADEEVQGTFLRLQESAWTTPLFRIAVAHAWTERLAGVTASAWPGIGFSSAAAWRLDGSEG